MKYTKPEILANQPAIAAIQCVGKGQPINLDCNHVRNCTNPAYEADE
jgi:hypothetical protein